MTYYITKYFSGYSTLTIEYYDDNGCQEIDIVDWKDSRAKTIEGLNDDRKTNKNLIAAIQSIKNIEENTYGYDDTVEDAWRQIADLELEGLPVE